MRSRKQPVSKQPLHGCALLGNKIGSGQSLHDVRANSFEDRRQAPDCHLPVTEWVNRFESIQRAAVPLDRARRHFPGTKEASEYLFVIRELMIALEGCSYDRDGVPQARIGSRQIIFRVSGLLGERFVNDGDIHNVRSLCNCDK